jgi:endo-1,4-beta-xylanase
MKRVNLAVACLITISCITACAFEQSDVMSDAYWQIWNTEEQARIDRDIDQHRKADAVINLPDALEGCEVKIEQISHDFVFGAHIFNFDQLGKDEYNRRYKELYGTLFNSATIAFYWKKFELEPGKPRFKGEYRDTAAYWNACKDPKNEPHWRRPATDPVVEFCESKGVRMLGHTICWGNRKWQHPKWLFDQYCPEHEKKALLALGAAKLKKMTPDEIAAVAPVYLKEQERLFDKRMREIAAYYKGRLHSWDVVNESARDFGQGRMIPDSPVCSSNYGLMPGDYTFRYMRMADELFPKSVLLNINDYATGQYYVDQVNDLRSRGCRIDIMGSQMHLFKLQDCLAIAAGKTVGKKINSPQQIRDTMAMFAQAGLPLHLSEITITSPGSDERGFAIQAVITRNLYRVWFSIKPMMGITWWNVVDDCGAPGEPLVSGLFTRDMQPKPAYFALNKLINDEWKTHVTLKAAQDGVVKFRGFKGKYRLSYKDGSGNPRTMEYHLTDAASVK